MWAADLSQLSTYVTYAQAGKTTSSYKQVFHVFTHSLQCSTKLKFLKQAPVLGCTTARSGCLVSLVVYVALLACQLPGRLISVLLCLCEVARDSALGL